MKFQPFGKLNESRLQRFEAQAGFSLPSDYRRFLLHTNGGVARQARVWPEDVDAEVVVDCLFGFGLAPALDLEAWLEEMAEELPQEAVTIGSDPYGALLVLVCSSEAAGIYHYDHAHQLDGSDETGNAYRIAESWADLEDAMGAPSMGGSRRQRVPEGAGRAAEDKAFAQKPAEATYWVPGGIERAKASGKTRMQAVDRLKQARFTHQAAFAVAEPMVSKA